MMCLKKPASAVMIVDSFSWNISVHFSKYPDGNITWKVNDIETLHSIRQLKLKTVSIELNPRTNKTIEYIEKKYRSNIF